jgi:PST family polysaccharide transporter
MSVLYPYICKKIRSNSVSFPHAHIYLLSSGIASVFLLQALIAPLYIDWLFAPQWHSSAAIVSLLCLSAIPGILIDTECNLLRASAQLNTEFFITGYCVLISIVGLFVLNPQTPMEFAQSVALVSVFWLSGFCYRIIFSPSISLKRVHI